MHTLLKQALRRLAHAPGFTAVTLVMLALGIGMSTSAFSTTNFLLLRTMPYPQGHELVRIFRDDGQGEALWHSPGNYFDIRDQASSFTKIAAFNFHPENVTVPGETPESITGITASAEFFSVLGVGPVLGRGFAPDEDSPEKGKSVVLTHSFWLRRFGGDPAVLGRTLRIGTENYLVVGVLSPVFETAPMWRGAGWITPMVAWPAHRNERASKWYDIAARLKPGVSLAQAQAELATIASRLRQDHPVHNGQDRLRVVDLYSSNFPSQSRRLIWLVTGLSILVLAIACANLASVQVARAFARGHELAVCAALGATRGQLIAPLLTESLLLSALGGGLGLLVTLWTNRFVGHYSGTPDAASIPVDGNVILFAIAMSVLTGLLFGLVPAWLATRLSAASALKQMSQRGAVGGQHRRLKFALIVGQISLALVLVSAAASFGIAAKRALRRDLGWIPGGLFNAAISLPYLNYPDDARKRTLRQTLHQRLREIPGVEQVVLSTDMPVYNYFNNTGIIVEGAAVPDPGQEPKALLNVVEPTFFNVLRIQVREGRVFSDNIKATDPAQVIVNHSVAARFWPGESAVGKRLRFTDAGPWHEVIGVVADVRMAVNFSAPGTRLQVYRSLEHYTLPYLNIVLRTRVPPASLTESVRKTLAAIDPDIAVYDAGSLPLRLRQILSQSNDLLIIILTAFATIGFFIALIGLYAVMSQLTQQRTPELGVRMALGANARDVMWLVLSEGGRLLVVGTALGVGGAIWVNTLYRQTLPELALPPVGLQLAIAALLILSGLCACLPPARRAARIDPAIALRTE